MRPLGFGAARMGRAAFGALALCAEALWPRLARAESLPGDPGSTSPPSAPSVSGEGEVQDEPTQYSLEAIELRGNTKTSRAVLARFLPFKLGANLDIESKELQACRYRLLGTGFFSSVQLSLKRGRKRGSVVLVVEVVERNTLVVQGLSMGIAADAPGDRQSKPLSPFLGVQVAETNLLGMGVELGGALGLAQQQLALLAALAAVPLGDSDWRGTVAGVYTDARDYFGTEAVLAEIDPGTRQGVTDYAVVPYRRRGGSLGLARTLGQATRLELGYRWERLDASVPPVASQLSQGRREPIAFGIHEGSSALSGLRASLIQDSRDLPFLPHHGSLLTAEVSLGALPLGSSYGYQKVTLGETRWFALRRGHTLRLDAQGGIIAGEAPFFEQFYVGDFSDFLPDRIVELSPDRRRAPNLLDTSIVEVRYGELAARLAAEYRVPLYRGRGSVFAIDGFLGAGVFGVATRRNMQRPGPLYHGMQRYPVDLTANLGFKVDTRVGGLTLALSNLLGILPGAGGGE